MNVKLKKQTGYQRLEGILECRTGLHIGNPGEVIEIGGLENAIIKHPITQVPYIPGSSLKGKMRALLELWTGNLMAKGEPHKCTSLAKAIQCPICRIFGLAGDESFGIGPARLVVRDAELQSLPGGAKLTETEVKWENVINRLSGTAEHPRQMERVPAGARFQFEMSYRLFEMEAHELGDNGEKQPVAFPGDEALFNFVLQGMRLLEMDTLGGSGSRGYGKVEFVGVTRIDADGAATPVSIKDVAL